MYREQNVTGLHVSARLCSRRTAHVLLSAGADQCALGAKGLFASDLTGIHVAQSPGKVAREAAFRRMLKRGPAYRTRSWAWPTRNEAAVTDTAGVAHSASCSMRTPVLGVRVVERMDRSRFRLSLDRSA